MWNILGEILPNNDNEKIKNVPSIAKVGVGMHCEAVGDNFKDTFECKDHHKRIFDIFLKINFN